MNESGKKHSGHENEVSQLDIQCSGRPAFLQRSPSLKHAVDELPNQPNSNNPSTASWEEVCHRVIREFIAQLGSSSCN